MDSKSPKKIAVVVDTLNGGGAEKVCLTLVKQLTRMGHLALLVVVKKHVDYRIGTDFRCEFLIDDDKAKLYKRKLQKHAAERLRDLSDDVGGFDLVLSNLDGAHPVAALAGLKNTWFVVHNSVEEKLKRAWRLGPIKYFRQKSVYRIFNKKNIVAVSKGLASELLSLSSIKPASVVTIYNPLDEDGIKSGLNDGVELPSFPYIIHVGRFAHFKRHDVLFKAFSVLKNRLSFKLKLVLLCEVSGKLRKSIRQYKLEDSVILPGFLQNPYPWMKHAKALVLSSDAEGFGMVLVEAMYCATPVVSTDCRHGPNEIMGKAFSEYLSPVGDYQRLAGNIEKALNENPDVKTAPILTELEPQRVAEKYLGLIN